MIEPITVSQNTENLFRRLAAGFKPPDNLTTSQWAEKHRRLSSETAAEPGPWRNNRTPYLTDVMDAFNDPKVKHIVLVAASQVGKTESELNILGYLIDQDPSSVLWIFPTTIDAKDFSKMRIAPMIRDCKTLRQKIGDAKSRDSNNTITQKTYPGGMLTMCGSTEAHALASKPIKYIIGDELDRWATSAGEEGDPWELAMARQTTFYNAKSIAVSTPTIKNASKIDSMYQQGTLEHWKTKCPHCGVYNEIQWEDIRYTYDLIEVNGAKTYKVTDIFYICPSCAAISDERTIKNQPAKWIADNPEALENTGTRSFWLNAFVSRWASWEAIIKKFLAAMNDVAKLQVVYNTCFGKLWENRGNLQDEEGIMQRRENYGKDADGNDVELPDGVLVLTCGIDTQDDRLEYEIVGYGHFDESWGIKKGFIIGRPDTPGPWAELDTVLDKTYHFADGIGLKITRAFIDEGGHFTTEVKQNCARRVSKRLFAVKGASKYEAPFVDVPKQAKILVNNKYCGHYWYYMIGTAAGKAKIFDNLHVQTPGARYCHFPAREDYGASYFKGLLSERLVYKKGQKNPWVWEKIPGHERNEALDCRNYSLAAFKSLEIDLDAIDRKLAAARAGKSTAQAQPRPKTPIQKTVHRNRTTIKNWEDEW